MKMGFKDVLNKAKTKINETIEKGNFQLKKIQNTKTVMIYSKPILGGFNTKKAFYEENTLLFPVEDFDEELIQDDTIIGLDEDAEYYVITKVDKEPVVKTITIDDKEFNYDCYTAHYEILNDAFARDVDGLPFYDLTAEQEKVLNTIKTKIEEHSLAIPEKKELCLHLWQLFVECIEYRKKDHYIVVTFSRIATEYVEDYSTYLIQLFA